MFENLVFTAHALSRMLERDVTGSQIEQVLAAPDLFRPGQGQSTILSRKFADGRVLKVYVAGGFPIEVPTIVITVAWKD